MLQSYVIFMSCLVLNAFKRDSYKVIWMAKELERSHSSAMTSLLIARIFTKATIEVVLSFLSALVLSGFGCGIINEPFLASTILPPENI